MTNKKTSKEERVRAICKKCADKLNLEPIVGEFMVCEPCADCGKFVPTQFTSFLKSK